METMTLTIEVPQNIGVILEEKAKNQGKDVAEYVENLIEKDIDLLKQPDNVLSLVYWKGQPAIIRDDEIDAIKEFTNDHQNIKLERTQVNVNDVARIIDGPLYSINKDEVFAHWKLHAI